MMHKRQREERRGRGRWGGWPIGGARGRPVPWAGLCLGLAAWLVLQGVVRAQEAGEAAAPYTATRPLAQAYPAGPPILPGSRQPGDPTPIPPGLPPVVYPFPSLQILIGSDFLDARSDDPELEAHAGTPFSTGAVFGLDFTGETWRLGYMRRVYRHSLGPGTKFRGRESDFVAIDTDALWAHGGVRPWRPVYAGVGLGLQRRRMEFIAADGGAAGNPVLLETVAAGEALLEYAFALPFAVQARYARDLGSPRIEMNGWTILIAYTIPL